jgi:hypothetical protein
MAEAPGASTESFENPFLAKFWRKWPDIAKNWAFQFVS